MTITHVLSRAVDVAHTHEDVRTAAQRMSARRVGTLVVVDDFGKPIGMLTDRDLALRVLGLGWDAALTTVGDVMTPHPVVVSEHSPLERALALMRKHAVRRAPVVGAGDRLIGVVSLDDIVRWLARQLSEVRRILAATSPNRLAQPHPEIHT